MKKFLTMIALGTSLALVGCDDAEKKAAEAKAAADKAAAEAKAAADKKAAEAKAAADKAAAEAAAKLKEELDAKKAEITKPLDAALAELDGKWAPLKEKAGKATGKAKAKAEAAVKAFDAARAAVNDAKEKLLAVADTAGITDASAKVTEALEALKKAFAASEKDIGPVKAAAKKK